VTTLYSRAHRIVLDGTASFVCYAVFVRASPCDCSWLWFLVCWPSQCLMSPSFLNRSLRASLTIYDEVASMNSAYLSRLCLTSSSKRTCRLVVFGCFDGASEVPSSSPPFVIGRALQPGLQNVCSALCTRPIRMFWLRAVLHFRFSHRVISLWFASAVLRNLIRRVG